MNRMRGTERPKVAYFGEIRELFGLRGGICNESQRRPSKDMQ